MTISVIIPVYQDQASGIRRQESGVVLLKRCLVGLDRQTYRDFSVTVVDDDSEPPVEFQIPDSPSKADRFQIRLLHHAHAGAPSARNLGARETNSEFLLFCDADVVLRPNALERMVQALAEHPEASYAYSRFRFGWKTFRSFPFDPKRLRRMPYIHTTALIRRAHFPGFDESLRRFQDWDLWLTMLEHGHIGTYIPESLFAIVHTRGTMSRWVPTFVYHLPWKTARVRAYDDAAAIIRSKHGLMESGTPQPPPLTRR
ncbi:MAG: glycosyltransferase family A protein [bacterium]|nr:glycosyltransferase family A protein [bacterium]